MGVERGMRRVTTGGLVATAVLVAGFVAADTKIVTVTTTDGFEVMGQRQPPRVDRQTIWLDADRMRVDQDERSFIVLPGEQRLLLLDHRARTWSVVPLPVDLRALLPSGTSRQMLEMMRAEATVTPRAETRTADGLTLHRYDLTLRSEMMRLEATLWVSPEVGFDSRTYQRLYSSVLELQPGMADLAEQLATVDGFVLEEDGTMSMAQSELETRISQRTESITEETPPPGWYAPPQDYTERPFDFMSTVGR